MTSHGTIFSFKEGKDNNHNFVIEQIKEYIKYCEQYNLPLPKFAATDDCCGTRGLFESAFGNHSITVCQDIKHLINRLIEKMAKSSDLYDLVTTNLHGAFTKDKSPVRFTDGSFDNIPSILPHANVIIERIEKIIEEANNCTIHSEYNNNSGRNGGKLFLDGFDSVWKNQKEHIRKGCCSDIYETLDDGTKKHYYEYLPGLIYKYKLFL